MEQKDLCKNCGCRIDAIEEVQNCGSIIYFLYNCEKCGKSGQLAYKLAENILFEDEE